MTTTTDLAAVREAALDLALATWYDEALRLLDATQTDDPQGRLLLALTAADVADRADHVFGRNERGAEAVRGPRRRAGGVRTGPVARLERGLAPGPPWLLAGHPQPRRLLPDGPGRSRGGRDRRARHRGDPPARRGARRARGAAGPPCAWAGSPTTCWPTARPRPPTTSRPWKPRVRRAIPCCCSRLSGTSATTPTTTATSPAPASDGRSRPLPAPGRGTSAGRSPSSCCWPCCTATRGTRRAHGRSLGRCCGGPQPSVRSGSRVRPRASWPASTRPK